MFDSVSGQQSAAQFISLQSCTWIHASFGPAQCVVSHATGSPPSAMQVSMHVHTSSARHAVQMSQHSSLRHASHGVSVPAGAHASAPVVDDSSLLAGPVEPALASACELELESADVS